MPRQTDYNEILTDKRTFINTQEWDIDESRDFYNTGFEKIKKMSKGKFDASGKVIKAPAPYCQYLYYLLPIEGKETGLVELSLGLFSGQAPEMKKSKMYQRVTITKFNTEKGEDWKAVLHEETMPEKQRPAPSEYPELKPYVNKEEKEKAPLPKPDEDEINIDDIPF